MQSTKYFHLTSLVFTLTLLLLSPSLGETVTLSINPGVTTIDMGQTFNVEIRINELEDIDLGVFDFNVLYDSSILNFTTYTLGTGLGDIGVGDALDLSFGDDAAGTINLAELSLLSDLSTQENTILLATLSFNALTAGNSNLAFGGIILGDFFGDPIVSNFVNGNVVVNAPVPEPSTILLFGAGLAGLAAVGRRRRN
jgi:hypothetical protein